MHDTLFVCILQCVADLGNDCEGFFGFQVAAAQNVTQVDAVHILHDEVIVPRLGPPRVIHGDDVRVIQPGKGLCLALESFCKGRVLLQFGVQNLEGDVAVEMALPGSEDESHPALADQFADLQLGKLFCQVVGVGGGGLLPVPSLLPGRWFIGRPMLARQEEAFWAKAVRSAFGHHRAALGARGHRFFSFRSHTVLSGSLERKTSAR